MSEANTPEELVQNRLDAILSRPAKPPPASPWTSPPGAPAPVPSPIPAAASPSVGGGGPLNWADVVPGWSEAIPGWPHDAHGWPDDVTLPDPPTGR
ncbi:hypothetical protein GCM10010434_077110 [Winogradskya humida]